MKLNYRMFREIARKERQIMELDWVNIIDEKSAELIETADYLWDHAEPAFLEFRSAERLCTVLAREGFTVTRGLAGIRTAFSASYGSGKPVIGILGEFDALEKLGQKAGMTEPCPDGQSYGHGCGHNLLGTAALGAAIAAKHYLQTSGHSGTVVYFGCPAEEGGSGKTFMARDGVFDSLDAAVCWHPDAKTGIRGRTSLANIQMLYHFDGIAAHASIQPELGRSALDAVELMNVGANYLREHMPMDARVHYAVTDSGGDCPNVVQAHAEVLYLIRARTNDQARELAGRVTDIARGAALMTQTKMTATLTKACSNTILNHTLENLAYNVMQRIALPEITEADEAYARELTRKALVGMPNANELHPIFCGLEPYTGQTLTAYGSTDVGDVSWICPTVQLMAATHALGTPNHSWQQTTQGKQPLAHKMMLYMAKALGATAAELIANPKILAQAKEEHRAQVGKTGYICPIPKDIIPKPRTARRAP